MVHVVSGAGHIKQAVTALTTGQPVVMPTETVYGLAAPTHDVAAIRRVYELKGRPTNNPLIAHVASVADVRPLTTTWHPLIDPLAEACWPGPLTLVVGAAAAVPKEATGGRSTIAIRVPQHPVAQALLEAFGGPLSAPSANRSGRVSPTTADHVAQDYADVEAAKDLLVLDGGMCHTGIESTVLDLTTPLPRILRLGSVSVDTLREVVGPLAEEDIPDHQIHAPGTAQRHYAPRLPVQIHNAQSLLEDLDDANDVVAVIGLPDVVVPQPHQHLILPDDADQAAHVLYALLREADHSGAQRLFIVLPPTEPAWAAIRDRLTRAAVPPEDSLGM